MIKFTLDLENNELVLEMEPPYLGTEHYNTTVCIQPDPCPGCGNCLLCDSKCTCKPAITNCFMAETCNEIGYCASPGNCTDYSPWKLRVEATST